MANKTNDLAHKRDVRPISSSGIDEKIIYNQYKESIRDILKQLCIQRSRDYRRASYARPYSYVSKHTTEIQCVTVYGILKGKSALMIYDKHANLKYKFETDISGQKDTM